MSEDKRKPSTEPSAEPSTEIDSQLVRVLHRVDRALGTGEQALLVAMLVVLVGVGAGQAVATKLGMSWAWSFEVIRYSVFFIAMTGAALSAHTGQLIAMDFVTRMLRPRHRARLALGLRIFTVAVCALLVMGGLELRNAAGATMYHVINPRVGLLALPIGAGLMGVHVAIHAVIDMVYLMHGRVPPPAQRSAH